MEKKVSKKNETSSIVFFIIHNFWDLARNKVWKKNFKEDTIPACDQGESWKVTMSLPV